MRGDQLRVNDQFSLREQSSAIVQHLMTPCDVEQLGEGRLRFRNAKTGVDLLVRYEPPQLRVIVETVSVDDALLSALWGPQLRRVRLQARTPIARRLEARQAMGAERTLVAHDTPRRQRTITTTA